MLNLEIRNGDINGDINSYKDTLEKVELTALINHIAIFLKSAIPIYNSEVPDTAGRKARRRRRTQVIAKRYAFHAMTVVRRTWTTSTHERKTFKHR